MVAVYNQTNHSRQVILLPNQSLGWEGNVWVVMAVSLVILIISIPIALKGLWVVLPFAIAQVLALGISLYLTLKKLSYKEIITLENGEISLQRGHCSLETSSVFPERSVRILFEEHDKPMTAPDIDMIAEGHCYHIGEFLNRSDRFKLAEVLKNQLNLPISHLGSFHRVSF